MSHQDDFDARLGAMFAEAAPRRPEPDFTAAVMDRIERPRRWRALVLTGAGLAGAAVAAVSLFQMPELALLPDEAASLPVIVAGLVLAGVAMVFGDRVAGARR
ncbi:hypothetical protein FKB34_04040 [Glycocaulis profundi]|nr:hypothetical protein FKB34_04040 [Glycocaulis profundi]